MTLQSGLFLLIALVAGGFSLYRFRTLLHMLLRQQGPSRSRTRELQRRIQAVIVNVFFQKAVLEKPGIGILHTMIFWGFLIISIGTLEQFVTTLNPSWDFAFLGAFYHPLLVLEDIMSFSVLLAVLGAAYRRFIIRPEGLGKSRDANVVLLLTGSLMISILLMNGFSQIIEPTGLPITSVVAHILNTLFTPGYETAQALSTFFKWIHMLIVLGFGVYIPGSKHLHLVAAGPNTFFKTLDRPKAMLPIDFTDEKITQYGAAKITDLSWKDALDTYACTECGRCQDLCPAYNTQKPLSPKMLIMDIKHLLHGSRGTEALPLINEHTITEDVIWACTSCRACEIACPVFIEHTDKIYAIRRNLVMMESKFPAEVQAVFRNLETAGAPWAVSPSERAAEGLPLLKDTPDAQVLLWVGCAGAFDDRNKKVVRAFANLLRKAGVKFAILGNEEQCTGDPARRIGNEYLYQSLAKANIELLARYSVKKIVTACPHCFNTLKNEYPEFGGTYEVIHHSVFLAELIRSGKIKPTKTLDDTVTFHDSCYLGRWNGIYDAPREALASLPAISLVEMKNHHDKSLCCGAGGGRMFMEEHLGSRINAARTDQALQTHAGIIASSCPFCMTMLRDGVIGKDMQEKIQVMDIAELLDQATP